jgi:hypothetical protein
MLMSLTASQLIETGVYFFDDLLQSLALLILGAQASDHVLAEEVEEVADQRTQRSVLVAHVLAAGLIDRSPQLGVRSLGGLIVGAPTDRDVHQARVCVRLPVTAHHGEEVSDKHGDRLGG